MTRFARPAVMGVLNITPDSFSDGGAFLDPAAALAHARRMGQEGADLIDVGGESTRPGAEPVSAGRGAAPRAARGRGAGGEGEVARLDRHLEGGRSRGPRSAGATFVNDVTALRGDPDMVAVVAESGATCA